jgi:hypothetical protein
VTQAALAISVLSLLAVVLVGWRTIRSGEQSARASVEAAEASKRAAEATEKTAGLVASSTRERRLGGVIENLVRIRALFNEQASNLQDVESWTPEVNSSEALARFSLCRELEGRLAPLTGDFGPESSVRALVVQAWDRARVESALQEAVKAIESV